MLKPACLCTWWSRCSSVSLGGASSRWLPDSPFHSTPLRVLRMDPSSCSRPSSPRPGRCWPLPAADSLDGIVSQASEPIAPPKPPCSASSFAQLGRTCCKSAACAGLCPRRFALPGRSFVSAACFFSIRSALSRRAALLSSLRYSSMPD
ncbi:hypothetical protein B0T16DRAFT_13260 [Cercophora newfieldiana]|uniref:Uncharacterized protein n=1 Tax=Cercophora newfieldiana TaxID=92897 RepID=A0AA39YPQ6_9PEZI|nr:hypothetical protein B0T16DRAFT_13260 [Cercophora newfieldiana]